jgi:hypothetical protein
MKRIWMIGLMIGLFGMLVACEEDIEPDIDLIGGVIANERDHSVSEWLELGRTYRGRMADAVEGLFPVGGSLETIPANETLDEEELLAVVEDTNPVVPWYDPAPMEALAQAWAVLESVLEDGIGLIEGEYVTLEKSVYHYAYTVLYVMEGDALYVELYWDKFDALDASNDPESLMSLVLYMDVIEEQLVIDLKLEDEYGETIAHLTEEGELVLQYQDVDETVEMYHYVHLGHQERFSSFETDEFLQVDAFDGETKRFYQVQFRLSDSDKGSELYAQYDDQGIVWSVQLIDAVGRYVLKYRLDLLDGWDHIVLLEEFNPNNVRSFDAVLTDGPSVVDMGGYENELWLIGVPIYTVRIEEPVFTEYLFTLGFSDLSFNELSFAAFTEHRDEVDRAFLDRMKRNMENYDVLDDVIIDYNEDHHTEE